jgi:hypothetical protein
MHDILEKVENQLFLSEAEKKLKASSGKEYGQYKECARTYV